MISTSSVIRSRIRGEGHMGAVRAQAVAVVALLALAAQSGPASADGPVGRPDDPYRYTPYDPAPPAFLVFNWSGFYIGGNVGWGYTSPQLNSRR